MIIHAQHQAALWTHWMSEPSAAIAIGATALVYGAGTRRVWRAAGRGRGVRPRQAWCFAAGIAVLVIALMSPVDSMAEDLFSAHMLQHVLLAVVAPPLLVAGGPAAAALWALPRQARSRLASVVTRRRWISAAWRAATATATAWAVHAIALWVWHVPGLYTLALRDPVLHAAEHASFVGTAALMWWGILHPRTSRRAGYATGILILFVTMLHSAALGAAITLSSEVWFPIHGAGAAAWGMTALEDQQLAGLIMWVPGGLLYLIGMGVLFVAWMQQSARRHALAAQSATDDSTLAGVALAAHVHPLR